MISNEILEEIIFTSSKGKYLTKFQIEKIVINVINNLDYISKNKYGGLVFGNEKCWKDSALATYNTQNGIITINVDQIRNEQEVFLKKHSLLTKNLGTLYILLHEIEHLKEEFKSMKNNVEGSILRFDEGEALDKVCKGRIKKYNKLAQSDNMVYKIYNDIYNINPFERTAIITSTKMILESIKKYPNFKKNHFGSLNYINTKYYNELCNGYVINKDGYTNFILYDYFKYLNSVKYLKEVIEPNFKISPSIDNLEDKMKLGFKVTSEEYNKTKNKKKIILKTTLDK